MKYLLFALLVNLIAFSSTAQETSDFTITVKTKFDSNVDLEYAVQHTGEHNFNDSQDSINLHIKKVLLDSLGQFDMYQMISAKRMTLQVLAYRIIFNEFEKGSVKIHRVTLIDVEIPKEAEIAFFNHEKLKQSYLDVFVEIRNKERTLEQKLTSNKDLTKSKIEEIENEILFLKGLRSKLKVSSQIINENN